MRKNLLVLSTIFFACILLQSCVKDTMKSTYTYFVAIQKSKSSVRESIKSTAPVALSRTGKIFLSGNYIFINEINKGVHIIDNSNPSKPVNTYFISIPGNIDIAVKGNTLYADLYSDLIAVDITNPAKAVLKNVNTDIFPERNVMPYFANPSSIMGTPVVTDTTKYIVDWKKMETSDKKEIDNQKSLGVPVWFERSNYSSTANPAASVRSTGIGGSMARLTVVNNNLYSVNRTNLASFDITTPTTPILKTNKTTGWDIETIYPLKDKLFIGSQTGMYIYSIINPSEPQFLGAFSHVCVSDPVIADDDYAFVTLRSDNASICRGVASQTNELDVLDISNMLQPVLVKVYNMVQPKGLSKDGNKLFICDGKAGLKIYDATNVLDLKLIKTINTINPFDVICYNNIAMVIAEEGIYQYDYSNLYNVRLLSKIETTKSK